MEYNVKKKLVDGIDPIYTQLDMEVSRPSGYPIMPDPKYIFFEKNVQWSFGFQNWDIPFVKVGKLENRKEVRGILIRTIKYDGFTSSRNQNIWNEFVPCEYNDCEIDTKRNLIKLSQIKDGKQLKGLMGYSTYWHIYTEGSVVYGYCSFTLEFTIPCEYDDIRLLHDASEIYRQKREQYYIVTKDRKGGLIKVEFSIVRGPFDDNHSNYRFRHNPLPKIKILLDCKYDSISKLSKAGNEVFVATNEVNRSSQQFVFDTDGFVIEDNAVGDVSSKLVLVNNSNNHI